jgi:hypothetical protein
LAVSFLGEPLFVVVGEDRGEKVYLSSLELFAFGTTEQGYYRSRCRLLDFPKVLQDARFDGGVLKSVVY